MQPDNPSTGQHALQQVVRRVDAGGLARLRGAADWTVNPLPQTAPGRNDDPAAGSAVTRRHTSDSGMTLLQGRKQKHNSQPFTVNETSSTWGFNPTTRDKSD